MNLDLALLADYANLTADGKLNILGVFQVLQAVSFPVALPQMQVVMSFEAGVAEASEEHKVDLQLIDADGKRLFAVSGQMAVGAIRAGEQFHAHHILTINNLRFDRPGDYRFDIFIDGQSVKELPLRVVERSAPKN